MRRWIFPTSIVFVVILLLALSSISNRLERAASLSPSSVGPTGLSVLNEVGIRLGHSAIVSWRKPILNLSDLAGIEAMLVFAPRESYSDRELDILLEFVSNGGHLFLSYHDKISREKLLPLLVKLGIEENLSEIKNFSDRTTMAIEPSDAAWPFEKGGHYTFYSRYSIGKQPCESGNKIECFYLTKKFGKGVASLFCGYPPFMNSLFGQTENASLGLALLAKYTSIAVDDYRNYFYDRTVWDLLSEPTFSLPIFGLVGAVMIFFLFGRLSLEDATTSDVLIEPELGSVHMLQEEVFRGLVRGKSLLPRLQRQEAFLKSLFPSDRVEIEDEVRRTRSDPRKAMRTLLDLHKKLLRNKGMKI